MQRENIKTFLMTVARQFFAPPKDPIKLNTDPDEKCLEIAMVVNYLMLFPWEMAVVDVSLADGVEFSISNDDFRKSFQETEGINGVTQLVESAIDRARKDIKRRPAFIPIEKYASNDATIGILNPNN